jgi:hypothetical protein
MLDFRFCLFLKRNKQNSKFEIFDSQWKCRESTWIFREPTICIVLTFEHVKTLARTENKCFDMLNVKNNQIVDSLGCPRSSTIIIFCSKNIKKHRNIGSKWWILPASTEKQAKSQIPLWEHVILPASQAKQAKFKIRNYYFKVSPLGFSLF